MPKRSVLKIILILLLLMSLLIFGVYSYFSFKVEKRFSGRLWSIPSYIFSETVILYTGQKIDVEDLAQMLNTRLYRQVRTRPTCPGEYHIAGSRIDVWFRRFDFPGKLIPSCRVSFYFSNGQLREIRKYDEKTPGVFKKVVYYELEPVELSRYYGTNKESRILVKIDRVPEHLKKAVIAVEDRRFYDHSGVDIVGILRALWVDIRARRVVQGGSTITQQLVKNYFLKPERTLKRKILEAVIAIVLETKYEKDQILEMYLNEIYMGQRGAVEIHGMGEAAWYYFGKNVEDLTLAESALLAGMIRGPNYYNPILHPRRAKARRNTVLQIMASLKMISDVDAQRAAQEPIKVITTLRPLKRAPYYVDTVFHQLKQLYPPEVLEKEGLVVYTTLMPEMQKQAEVSLRTVLQKLEKVHLILKRQLPTKRLQGVVIGIQPKTGAIRFLIGGRDYATSTYNRALLAKRQPGSAIKPFIYYTAIHEGWTLTSWLEDSPYEVSVGNTIWKPKNYDHKFRGRVTLRQALEQSLNVPTVRLAMAVGLNRIIDTLHKFGFTSPMKPLPSLALGAFEVTPIELASAYTVFANEGEKPFIIAIKAVYDSQGRQQQRKHIEWQKVTTPEEAFLITSVLEGVVQRGTARSLSRFGVNFPCAGKTGTTSDYRDSWFVGYTTDLVVLVWIGFDNGDSTHLSGASGALKVWAHLMNHIGQWIHPQPFYPPPHIISRKICATSGALATPNCPETVTEFFIEGTEPTYQCPIHKSRRLIPRFLLNRRH